MMKEPKPGGQQSNWENLEKSEREDLDGIFDKHYLSYDVANDLEAMSFYVSVGNFDNLKPIPTYDAHVREAAKRRGTEKKTEEEKEKARRAYYDYVMQRSDSERVAQYDKMVEEFNADLDRIKRERDKKAFNDFAKKANEFLRERKEE